MPKSIKDLALSLRHEWTKDELDELSRLWNDAGLDAEGVFKAAQENGEDLERERERLRKELDKLERRLAAEKAKQLPSRVGLLMEDE